MTDVEILKNAVDVLGAINVPVGLLESIGAPIYQVRKNLKMLLDAVNAAKTEDGQPEEQPEMPELNEE